MQIIIQTFGAFRQFGNQINLHLDGQALVADIRPKLVAALADKNAIFDIAGLVESSKFATETAILNEDQCLSENMLLTILPPVSGG